ncbi:MAG: CaiB/BaiF CoA transferase family protein [Dehalococcoidia bacterium]
MPAPLDGIRVLDLSIGPAAGMATMVLGDFGADVVKVEPPGGDPYRAVANAPLWLRGKQSVVLDLKTAEGRAELQRLATAADVLVTTQHEEQAAARGHDYASLSAANPSLVYCRLTGWGPKGPYRDYPAYEGVVAAKSGRMLMFSDVASRPGPGFAAVRVGMHASSQSIVAGVCAALFERESSGRGQLVETSLLQGMLPYDLLALLRSELASRMPEAFPGNPLDPALRVPTLNYHPLPTKDGRWLQMGNLLQHLFDNYLMAAGLEEAFTDLRFEGPPAGWAPADREEFRDKMLRHMRTKTAAEWLDIFVEHGGVAATEYRHTQAAMDDPDLICNGHVVEQQHPKLGKVQMLGVLARLNETPGTPGGPSHEAGADSAALPALWAAPQATAQPGPAAPKRGGPLEGVTIIEFATIIAAPLAVSILGDLGARVIKVEPIGGDPYRGLGLFGMMAAKTNASKQSIGVDLKDPEGLAVVQGLIRNANAVIHNYRPGVPERLGIGYEQCEALRPGIVHVGMNGYGPEGPGAHRPSTHPVPGAGIGGATLQAAGAHLVDSDDLAVLRAAAIRLFRANEANPDPNTSVVLGSSAMLALLAQRRYGVGQRVYVDMFGANAYANCDDMVRYAGKPPRPEVDADVLGLSATYRLYPAADGWVFLGLCTDADYAAFREATGFDHEGRYASPGARAADDARLASELAAFFASRSADALEARLAPVGIGCVRADRQIPGDFWHTDPHVRENGFIVGVEHGRYGRSPRWGTLTTSDRTPSTPGPGCLGGDHTRALLAELGYGEGDVERLYAKGVVWSEEVGRLQG